MSEVPKGTLKTMLWEATQRINTLEAEVRGLREILERMIKWDDAGVEHPGENIFDDIMPAIRAALNL